MWDLVFYFPIKNCFESGWWLCWKAMWYPDPVDEVLYKQSSLGYLAVWWLQRHIWMFFPIPYGLKVKKNDNVWWYVMFKELAKMCLLCPQVKHLLYLLKCQSLHLDVLIKGNQNVGVEICFTRSNFSNFSYSTWPSFAFNWDILLCSHFGIRFLFCLGFLIPFQVLLSLVVKQNKLLSANLLVSFSYSAFF